MNSIGSAGCATTSDVSASDRGSPTVRFKNSASIAAPAEPTFAAMLLLLLLLCTIVAARLCQRVRDRDIERAMSEVDILRRE